MSEESIKKNRTLQNISNINMLEKDIKELNWKIEWMDWMTDGGGFARRLYRLIKQDKKFLIRRIDNFEIDLTKDDVFLFMSALEKERDETQKMYDDLLSEMAGVKNEPTDK